MKILVINPLIRSNQPPQCFPLGLGYIAAALLNEGHKVEAYDINGIRPRNEDVIERIKNDKSDLIAIGGLVTTINHVDWLIKTIRKYSPDKKIILGGGLGTSIPEISLNQLGADVVVLGEGEITICELVRALEGNMDLQNVNGIAYLKDGKMVKTPSRKNIENLDTIAFPAWDIFPMDVYTSSIATARYFRKRMDLISSRGCPYNCTFCFHLFGRSSMRFRSARNILDEIEILYNRYDVRFIEFADDNFLVNRARALEFCNLLKKSGMQITWSSVGRVDNIDGELLRIIRGAGCRYITYGFESSNLDTLKKLNKRTTPDLNGRAIELTRKNRMYVGANFIFGVPGEGRDSMRDNIDFCIKHKTHCSPHILQAYPGTPLYEQVKSSGRIQNEYEYIRRLGDTDEIVLNVSGVSDNELLALVEQAKKETKPSVLQYIKEHLKVGGVEGLCYQAYQHIKPVS